MRAQGLINLGRLWQSGHSDLLSLPAVIGHEAAGIVTEVGDAADEALLGSRVFVDGYGGFAEFTVVTDAMRRRQNGPFLLPAEVWRSTRRSSPSR